MSWVILSTEDIMYKTHLQQNIVKQCLYFVIHASNIKAVWNILFAQHVYIN